MALATTSSHAARSAPATIRLYEKPLSEHFTDLGAKGAGAGDIDVATYLLYKEPRSPTPIGHSEAVCTLIGLRAAECTSTIYLPGGKIVGGGAFHFQDRRASGAIRPAADLLGPAHQTAPGPRPAVLHRDAAEQHERAHADEG